MESGYFMGEVRNLVLDNHASNRYSSTIRNPSRKRIVYGKDQGSY